MSPVDPDLWAVCVAARNDLHQRLLPFARDLHAQHGGDRDAALAELALGLIGEPAWDRDLLAAVLAAALAQCVDQEGRGG